MYFSGKVSYPDIYMYLVVSPETSIARRGHKRFENMGPLNHIQMVEYAYDYYFEQHPQPTRIIKISGELSIPVVYSNVKKVIESLLIL